MSASFDRVSSSRSGYSVSEVDAFLAEAREAYEDRGRSFDAGHIAAASFGLEKGGYSMRAVDEALDRLADAFALRARDEAIQRHGEDAWVRMLTERAEELKERLERPAGQRFAPGRDREQSYDRGDVDALCDELVAYFTEGHPMSVDDVRRAAFRPRKGADGYSESVVDVYLHHVADVMASVP